MHRIRQIALGVVALALLAAVLVLPSAPARASTSTDAVAVAVNQQRAANGVGPLVHDTRLDAIAQQWADQMASQQQMVHSTDAWRAARMPAGWTWNGENIAFGFPDAGSVMTAWMNSPGHKTNILSTHYTAIGVGYNARGNYWVQTFAGFPPGATYQVAAAPAPAPAPAVQPVGTLDVPSAVYMPASTTVFARGWAVDPATASRAVVVTATATATDGSRLSRSVVAATPDSRAASVSGAGTRHGYSVAVPVSRGGVYRVCVDAKGTQAVASLGCRTVATGSARAAGRVETTRWSSGTTSVTGWAVDWTSPTAASRVVVSVDGRPVTTVSASGPRPDLVLSGVLSNPAHGFRVAVPAPAGSRVCVSVQRPGAPASVLACRTAG